MAHQLITAMSFAQKFEPFMILLTKFPTMAQSAPSQPRPTLVTTQSQPAAPALRGPARLTQTP